MSFLDPSVLGPLFRFNREFYDLDERGRPIGYRNLEKLHQRIKPFLLRRRKADVETELPDRTDQRYFVALSPAQADSYSAHEAQVARLVTIAKRRPLTQQESEKLQRELAMMRMICDTNFILDPKDRTCPKLAELKKILEECRNNTDVKVIVFSEWARMLELVKELCERLKIGYALHTGSVPQRRRRAEIQLFKSNPDCRVFLSTDSGSTGLNLQNASVVVNCDLPWNPARLEQLISPASKPALPVVKKKALPADRPLGFSKIARELLGAACVRCEERYPLEGPHSVIVIVVDRDASLHREKLAEPFEEYFGREVSDPLAPVRLEVIDRATDEAMARLAAAGLISPSTRAIRDLGMAAENKASGLTEAEQQLAQEHRRQASRKLKMAALLGGGGLLEEEREALLQSGLWLAKALAVEHRIAEPGNLEDALRPPNALFWGDHLAAIRAYAADPSFAPAAATTALRALAGP